MECWHNHNKETSRLVYELVFAVPHRSQAGCFWIFMIRHILYLYHEDEERCLKSKVGDALGLLHHCGRHEGQWGASLSFHFTLDRMAEQENLYLAAGDSLMPSLCKSLAPPKPVQPEMPYWWWAGDTNLSLCKPPARSHRKQPKAAPSESGAGRGKRWEVSN